MFQVNTSNTTANMQNCWGLCWEKPLFYSPLLAAVFMEILYALTALTWKSWVIKEQPNHSIYTPEF